MHGHRLRQRGAHRPPPAIVTARQFCSREIGVLAEQGVHDRARILLAKRIQAEPREPEPYLDAVRLELGVPSSGSAWRAWLVRALEAGVAIADRIAEIVPEPALQSALTEVAPALLWRQPDRASALDLLRLRACALLTSTSSEPEPRALDVVEAVLSGELPASSDDAALFELCAGVLIASALVQPEPVARLAASLEGRLGEAERAELEAELRLARRYRALELPLEPPAPIERALGLLGRCTPELDRALLAELDRDVRARPARYLAWADAVGEAAPELTDAWLTRWRAIERARQSAWPQERASGLIHDATRAIERDALRFLPLPASDLALYRKHARHKAWSALVEHAPEVRLESLRGLAQLRSGAAGRALAHLGSDPALALFDQLLRLARR